MATTKSLLELKVPRAGAHSSTGKVRFVSDSFNSSSGGFSGFSRLAHRRPIMHQFVAEFAMSLAGWLVTCLITTCRHYGLMITDMKGGDRMSFKRSSLTGKIEEVTLAIQVRHYRSESQVNSDIVDRTLLCGDGLIKVSSSVFHARRTIGLQMSNSIPANCCDVENRCYP